VKKHHLIINLEQLKAYDHQAKQIIINKAFFYQAESIMFYGQSFNKSQENIEDQILTSNIKNHIDLVVVDNLLEHLPIEYLGVVIKDIFSYSCKHIMVILSHKSDKFKPVVKQLSKYKKHSFFFNS
jgi:hypothetical protein|tara:strand:- start:118 stop:495 length:378 start_codon:yes stop_codon:yes gene_type:complete